MADDDSRDFSFDEELVRRLSHLLKETDLSEIEYETGGHRIRVARQISVQATAPAAPAAPAQASQGGEPSSAPRAGRSPRGRRSR